MAFVRSLTNGPIGLSLHAALGSVLVLIGLGLAIRAGATRRWGLLALAISGFAGIAGAAASGVRFVGTGNNGASMGMAASWAVAFIAYLIIMFVTFRDGTKERKALITQ